MTELNCQFYENKYPEIGEVVLGRISKITEAGVYVQLLEYNHIDGLIVVGELSKKRIKNIVQVAKVGRTAVATVLRVDKEKGYIDLSRKKVQANQSEECYRKYSLNKVAHNIMVSAAQKLDMRLYDLYSQYGWPKAKEYGSLHKFLEVVFNSPEVAGSDKIGLAIRECVKQKFVIPSYRVRADVDVSCPTQGGVEHVKLALSEAIKLNDKIEITNIRSPTYSISLTTLNKENGIEILKKACSCVNDKILNLGGTFNIVNEPKIYGDKGSDTISSRLEDLELELDEDEEEEEEESS
ncbi:Eukaryotic translation initiation factor 2 subunit alpha [Astathelohania contejeani]|uniref:Eukaryotic translation initiation factor 2 subunit alpha n=1 Tax=Astathelohania contejeani TaxID=164912 RepID=A0ABQ7HZ46_9MICR|nr:Eukaryotic translation initiation factor 2 subunit alpha [Thelohania contejeani]